MRDTEKFLRDMAVYYAPTVGQKFLDCADDYAALLARHNALREAVKKLKPYAVHTQECCEDFSSWCSCGLDSARAEVNRLMEEE